MVASQVLSMVVFSAEAVVTSPPALLVLTIDAGLSMDRVDMSLQVSLSTYRTTFASLWIDTFWKVTVVSF